MGLAGITEETLESGRKALNTKGANSPLRTRALKALGKEQIATLDTGEVTALGFEFFEDGKPKTAWVVDPLTPQDVCQALFAQGIYKMNAAYQVAVKGEPTPLFVSVFHTTRLFGSAPAVRVGDAVEVHVFKNDKSDAGYGFAYRTLKKN